MRTLIFCCALIVSIVLSSCKNKTQRPLETAVIAFKKEATLTINRFDGTAITFHIELADSDYERETGLMHRTKMSDDQGMLFVFEKEDLRYFYMKNTPIPLDLIFINSENRIVSIHSDAKPMSEATISSKYPAKYVLEINAGLSSRNDIQEGMEIAYDKTISND